ncbi:MAG TPA: pilin [Candidatus Paceibacterota bacterium]|nr:pilin [Candidatus Paceibacterota bacterium]
MKHLTILGTITLFFLMPFFAAHADGQTCFAVKDSTGYHKVGCADTLAACQSVYQVTSNAVIPCQPEAVVDSYVSEKNTGSPVDPGPYCYVGIDSSGKANPLACTDKADCETVYASASNVIAACEPQSKAISDANSYNAANTNTVTVGNGSTASNGENPSSQQAVGPGGSIPYANGSCVPLVQCMANCGFPQILAMIKCIVTFLLFYIATPFAAVFFVYAGFLYMTSAGDPGKARLAKDIFVWIVFGFIIALVAWLLINALLLGLGVKDKFNFLSETLALFKFWPYHF